jgi:phosphatidylinositol glycan class M
MIKSNSKVRFGTWLILSFTLRLIVIAITHLLEKTSSHDAPTWTDIDYHVFSDAGLLLLEGRSPYDRVTYRYPPIIAYFSMLNHVVHPTSAKVIFSVADIIAGFLMHRIILIEGIVPSEDAANAVVYGWLLNPISINISTRGSADSLPCVLSLAALLGAATAMMRYRAHVQLKSVAKESKMIWLQPIILGAVAHGLAIHLKLYPVIYYPAFLSFCFQFRPPGCQRCTIFNIEVRRLSYIFQGNIWFPILSTLSLF